MANIKSLYDTEIAMMEHEFIKDAEVLETASERQMWYLAGVHDFADAVIRMIQEKEAF